ncbi:hypothetical protein COXBURSA331_A1075 [Coxiella burnetii RSA 331]|nr:hypothetical protein COXBURSA331_A1075 [Coxiella burnetii RSA 331]EDR36393.1 hypothetical protein COXBURSA334_0875 [Coxiella burnetii Q321]
MFIVKRKRYFSCQLDGLRMMIVWENKILYCWASQAQPNLRA